MNTHEAQPLNVLVVDDDPAALRLIAKIVSTAGHRVSQAENGRQARDMILQELPDLVVCDWDMPELDGVGLCREIRQQELPQYVYFLLLTGKSGTRDVLEGLAAGADDFLSKPIDRAVLMARLEAGARVLRMERRLRTVSQYDPLTGVMNRRAFHQHFDQEWKRAARYDHPLSCVMVDLDFFKRINDTHGHAAGDATLAAVASLLADQCRPSDILCRYGGEEFCTLLTETNEAGAAQWAERVRTAISETPIHAGDVALRITTSLGVAQRLDDTASPEQLVELADQGLAVAKQSGRNRVVRFGSLNEPMLDPRDKQAVAGPLDGVSARDVMSVAIVCPNQDDTVRHVTDLFLQLRLNSAPVVDETGTVVGIVAEADLLTRTALAEGWEDKIRDVMREQPIGSELLKLGPQRLPVSGYIAADELYDGPFCVLSIVDNRTFRRITYEVLDHDPTHADMERFFHEFQTALQQRGLVLQGITTDASALYPELISEVFVDVPHQVCEFHVIKELTKAVLRAVAKVRKELAATKPKLGRGRPSSAAARQQTRLFASRSRCEKSLGRSASPREGDA